MKKTGSGYKYKNVMLIDDNELDNFINQKIIEVNHFSDKKYVHTSAVSALDLLARLTSNGKENGVYPEVIFVDLNMPVMDGFQFIETFKERFEEKVRHPKIVVLTSSVNERDKEKASEISKDIIFLNKPLTPAMLEKI